MNQTLKHGYLYLADLNPSYGSEPGKLRPVLVIQNNFLNQMNHSSAWVLPCTTKCVGENILRVELPKNIAGNSQESEIMIDQSRAIDCRRIKKELEPLPKTILKEVKEKLRLLADL